jgi:formyl-CoA transferase
MEELEVVASPIYTVEDILADQTFRERGSVVEVEDQDLGPVRMQGVVPQLVNYPGSVWRTAPSLGEDTDRVLTGYLGITPDEVERLRTSGTI